jgi:hypothetical protein
VGTYLPSVKPGGGPTELSRLSAKETLSRVLRKKAMFNVRKRMIADDS